MIAKLLLCVSSFSPHVPRLLDREIASAPIFTTHSRARKFFDVALQRLGKGGTVTEAELAASNAL